MQPAEASKPGPAPKRQSEAQPASTEATTGRTPALSAGATQISPFKAAQTSANEVKPSPVKAAEANRRGKVKPEKKADQKPKARRKIVLPSPPSAKKPAKSSAKSKAKTVSAKQKQGGSAIAAVPDKKVQASKAHTSRNADTKGSHDKEGPRNDCEGVEFTTAASLEAGKVGQSDEDVSHKTNAGEKARKAVQPGGKLRAFADPNELPQTKFETPHTEPADAPDAVEPRGKLEKVAKAMEVDGDKEANQASPDAPQAVAATASTKGKGDKTTGDMSPAGEATRQADSPAGAEKSMAEPSQEEETVARAVPGAEGQTSLPDPSSQKEAAVLRLTTNGSEAERPADTGGSMQSVADASRNATPADRQSGGTSPSSAPKSAAKPRGLRPIPDSTMLDPDPEALSGFQSGGFQGGGFQGGNAGAQNPTAPKRGLRPIPDSTMLDPMPSRESPLHLVAPGMRSLHNFFEVSF